MQTGEKTRLKAILIHEKHSKEVLILNSYLSKYANKPNKLAKEIVFKKVYGASKKFDEPKLTQLRYKLFKIAENFLLINWLTRKAETNKDHLVQKQMMLLEYYRSKELQTNNAHTESLAELIKYKLSDIDKNLKKTEAKNVDYYYHQHKLNHHYYYSLNSNIWKEGKKYLEDLIKNLDLYYCLAKMRYYSEALNRKNSSKEEFETVNLNHLKLLRDDLFNFKDDKVVILKLYDLCLKVSNNPNIDNVSNIVNETIENESLLDKRELGFIINHIVNNTIRLKRRDGENINELNYKIYKLGLKRDVFIENGLLRPILLTNYFYLCTKVGSLDEIDAAWRDNENRIKSDFKEPTYNLYMAFKQFKQNEYEQAIEFTKRETVHKFRFYLFRKILQILSLYELKRYVEIEAERLNLLKYIRSNKEIFNEFNYNSYYNFSEMIRDLTKTSVNKNKLLKLFEDKNYVVVERDWLISKIKEK